MPEESKIASGPEAEFLLEYKKAMEVLCPNYCIQSETAAKFLEANALVDLRFKQVFESPDTSPWQVVQVSRGLVTKTLVGWRPEWVDDQV